MLLRAVPVLLLGQLLHALDDLETAALTVYRNPHFFGHLGQGFDRHGNLQDFRAHDFFGSFSEDFFQQDSPFNVYKPTQHENQEDDSGGEGEEGDGGDNGDGDEESGGDEESDSGNVEENGEEITDGQDYEEEKEQNYNEEPPRYKYPGETKKPNPPGRPNINVHYDNSPDFHHPSRNVPSRSTPKKGRGPYGHPRYDDGENYAQEEENDYQDESEGHQSYPEQGHEKGAHEDIFSPDDTRQEVIETKKGTREYLKHNKLPGNHEENQIDYHSNERKFKYKITRPKSKYFYKIRPVYSRYRIIPVKRKKLKKVFIIQPVYQRRSLDLEDDSAYFNNSELDGDYQIKSFG